MVFLSASFCGVLPVASPSVASRSVHTVPPATEDEDVLCIFETLPIEGLKLFQLPTGDGAKQPAAVRRTTFHTITWSTAARTRPKKPPKWLAPKAW